MRTSGRGEVDPFIVMDVMEAARAEEMRGRSVIHMEVGQPGTPAPRAAREALAAAMAAGALGYTVALGLPALRARIARLYGEWYGVDLDPGRVVVTAGSSAGFILAFTSLFSAGERVAIAEPGYPSYRNILKALDLEPVGLAARIEDRFQPTPETLPDGIAGLLVASPANPTGSMLGREALAALVEACAARGRRVRVGRDLSRRPVRGAGGLGAGDHGRGLRDQLVLEVLLHDRLAGRVDGASPQAHVRRIERLAQNLFICAPHASQVAALAALDAEEELQANLAVYRANRALLLEGLPGAGFGRIAPPDGAFYVYADVSDLTADSRDLARRILTEAGVAVTPGLDFDPRRGLTTLRFSYAGATADIGEGLRRLRNWAGR
jgi:aspartate/methionine/tyrosine aminotransferase